MGINMSLPFLNIAVILLGLCNMREVRRKIGASQLQRKDTWLMIYMWGSKKAHVLGGRI